MLTRGSDVILLILVSVHFVQPAATLAAATQKREVGMSSVSGRIATFIGTRSFLIGIMVTGVAGIALVAVGDTEFVWGTENVWRQLLGSLGDALVIATFLALLVDPVAQIRFARRWGRDLFWAIFNPLAPDKFRDALKELAAPKGYFRICTYRFTMDWADGSHDVLNVRLHVTVEATVLDPAGFNPSIVVRALMCHDGSPSRYVHWAFRGEDVRSAEFDESELSAQGIQVQSLSGHTDLHQEKLNYKGVVPQGKTYVVDRTILMERWKFDYLPVYQANVTLEQLVIVRGSAVSDLNCSVYQLAGPEMTREEVIRPDGKMEIWFHLPVVSFPGQASILEWRPRKG
jgi:hypothetical protein